uniref:RNA-dependent RNA polymerase n=1 Tax=Plasmopara viticola lesion associated mitovirus 36 TaxID=2719463 RepID=A0A6G9RTC8_9VIRU|nr:RNA-dependent RNA polymerase [Plasmopara viticola lesion associated mitovirus 36]
MNIYTGIFLPYCVGYKPSKVDSPSKEEVKPILFDRKEHSRMLRIISLLFNLDKPTTRKLHVILDDFMSILSKSGTKMLAQYWSECFRLIGQFISGTKIPNTKIRVKKYKNGLPRILGNNFKQFIENQVLILNSIKSSEMQDNIQNQKISPLFRAIITIFAWNRGIGVKHEIRFNSVTNPHSGEKLSLDLSTIKESLAKLSLGNCNLVKRLSKPTFFISNKSGTNSKLAFLSFGLDTVGFIRNPKVLLAYLKLCYKLNFRLLLVVFILCLILCLPLSLLIIHHPIYLGRLAIIKELKGKARVIGITDQWTQWLLKPVHDAIADILSDIPEDGTHNQLKPVKSMLSLHKGSNEFNSLDLSNATDRLPVAFQADILSCLGFPGQDWMSLLQRPYNYDGINYDYAVGQPMGAYSSFVMLALANHVLVLSSLDSYNKGSGQYAVLGDDVCIHSNAASLKYTGLLRLLGVEVNPVKGFFGDLIEFAKNWFHSSGINLSPLGTKVLLRTSRKPVYFTALLMDFFQKEFNSLYLPVLDQINQIILFINNKDIDNYDPNDVINKGLKWLFCSLGPQSGLHSIYLVEQNVDVTSIKMFYNTLLSRLGLTESTVSTYYVKLINKASWVRIHHLSKIMKDFRKNIIFLLNPQIWNSKNPIWRISKINHGYLASVITIASGPLLLLLLVRITILKILSLIVPLLCSIYLTLIGGSHLSKRFLNNIYYFWNSLKRWYHNFILQWDLVNAGKAEPEPIQLQFKTKGPSNLILRKPSLFYNWVKGTYSSIPIQLLCNIVVKREPDTLPAVITTEKLLCSLVPEYNKYFVRNKSLLLIELKKKRKTKIPLIKKSYKRIKKVNTRNKGLKS